MAGNLSGNINNLMTGIGNAVNAGVNIFTDSDQKNKVSQARALGKATGMQQFSTGNFDSLMGEWNGLAKTNYTKRDFFNPTGKEVFLGMLNAGIQGMQIGNQIGSAIGGIAGSFKGGTSNNVTANVGAANVGEVENTNVEVDPNTVAVGKANGGYLADGGAIGGAVGAAFLQGLQGLDYALENRDAKLAAPQVNAEHDYYNAMMTHNYANAAQNTYNQMFNAKKMNLAEGGPLFSNGINWASSLNKVNTGGTHEENPNNGVKVGEANGVEQKVEENETIRTKENGERFVFSNRILAKKEFLEEANLPVKYAGKPYAEISEEYRSDVNDPISKKGNEAMLDRLEYAQEAQKLAEQEEQMQEEVQPSLEDMNVLNQMQAMQNEEQLPQEQMQPSEDEIMQQQMMQQMMGSPQQMPQQFAKGGCLYPNGGPQTVVINGKVVPFNLVRDSYGTLARDTSTMGYDVIGEDEAKAYIDRDGKIKINLNKDFDTTGLEGVADTIEFNSIDEYNNFLKGIDNQWNIYNASSSNPLGRAVYSKDGKHVDIADEDFDDSKYKFVAFDSATGKNLYSEVPQEPEEKDIPLYSTAGRVAPIMQSIGALLTNAAMQPDYTYPEAIEDIASRYSRLNAHPVGDSYRFVEQPINYIANQIASNNRGLARNLLDAASGNRLAVLPSLIAANAKSNEAIGDVFNKGFEANNASRNQVAQLRTNLGLANAQDAARTDSINGQFNSQALAQLATAAAARENISNAKMPAISAASQAVANNIGRYADENFAMNNVNRSGLPYGYDWRKTVGYTGSQSAFGGPLDSEIVRNIKRNKR